MSTHPRVHPGRSACAHRARLLAAWRVRRAPRSAGPRGPRDQVVPAQAARRALVASVHGQVGGVRRHRQPRAPANLRLPALRVGGQAVALHAADRVRIERSSCATARPPRLPPLLGARRGAPRPAQARAADERPRRPRRSLAPVRRAARARRGHAHDPTSVGGQTSAGGQSSALQEAASIICFRLRGQKKEASGFVARGISVALGPGGVRQRSSWKISCRILNAIVRSLPLMRMRTQPSLHSLAIAIA